MFNGDGKTKVVVIRHGNTFKPEEPCRRVGCKTDLPLVQSGIDQAKSLGKFLKTEGLIPHTITSAPLKRTLQTAQYLLQAMQLSIPVTMNPLFSEIDYGIDENQLEEKVVERIGESALNLWNDKGIPPQGWNVNPEQIIQNWNLFLNRCATQKQGQTTFVVTSNGIARFLIPALQAKVNDIKLKTGHFALLELDNDRWSIARWNYTQRVQESGF